MIPHIVFGSIYVAWTLIFGIWYWLLTRSDSSQRGPGDNYGSGILGVIFISCIAYGAGIAINSIAYAVWFNEWILVILAIMSSLLAWEMFKNRFI